MKICTSCKTEIHSEARRCPQCQSFQKWWYGFIPMLPLILMLLLMFPFWLNKMSSLSKRGSVDFEELKGKVTLTKLREEIVKERRDFKELKILVELKNHTNTNWENPTFEITFKNMEGEILSIQHKKEYNAKLPANGITHVAMKFPTSGKIEDYQTEVKLTELKED